MWVKSGGSGCASQSSHRRAVQAALQHVRHVSHPMRYHVFDWWPTGQWRVPNLSVQLSLILPGSHECGVNLRQIRRNPLLADCESEAGPLARHTELPRKLD
jgi:hypothetical protein